MNLETRKKSLSLFCVSHSFATFESMTPLTRTTACIACLLTISMAGNAQTAEADTLTARYEIMTEWFAPEKLYLHTDRTAFHAGETIWFCGYLKNAADRVMTPGSNYIYVELVRKDGTVARRVKIKRTDGAFPGHIDLQEDLDGGGYTLRAYSLWQMNFSDDFMFHQEIEIVGEKSVSRDGHATKSAVTDISFYPEGGRYFVGIPARIGFKAMDALGRSIDLEGDVTDLEGNVITTVRTRHDGMGLIQLIPESTRQLYLMTDDGGRHPLPPPAAEGAAVSVLKAEGRRIVRVQGISGGRYRLYLRDIGATRAISEIDTGTKSNTFIIPESELASGINSLILTDTRGNIVSERHFFHYGEGLMHASVHFDGAAPGTRRAVTAGISLADSDGKAADGRCSVSVLKGSMAAYTQDDSMESYMLLSSELRGAINEPRYYFDRNVPEKERAAHLDLLMMIQGWSYFDMDAVADPGKVAGQIRHLREYFQSVRGKVSRPLSSKTPRKFDMLVIVPRLGTSRYVKVEEGSSFIMDSLDFEEGTGFMIKVRKQESIGEYIPSWEGDVFARERSYAGAPGRSGKPSLPAEVDYEVATDTLEAAVLTGQAVHNDLGVSGHTLPQEDQKSYANTTLIDYLKLKAPAFQYRGGLMYSLRSSPFDSYGQRTGPNIWDESPVQLVVDGAVEPWEGFENLTIGETESISISTDPDIIYRAKDGVVAVRLRYGVTVSHNSGNDLSMLYFTPLGWQTPAEFYAPRYDRGDTFQTEDRRNTILWNPGVSISNGEGKFTFCTSDEEEWPYCIIVEGISTEGKAFSTVAFYGSQASKN